MQDLLLVHLSDLHITEGPSLSIVHKNLLKDMVSEIKRRIPKNSLLFNKTTIVIAVTGDIFHRAPLKGVCESGNKSAYKLAHEFFEIIQNELEGYKIHPFFVPGNHDKSRTTITDSIIKGVRSRVNCEYSLAEKGNYPVILDRKFHTDFWNEVLEAYTGNIQAKNYGTGYLDLVEEIKDMFNAQRYKSNPMNSYGVFNIETEDKSRDYCFVCMDTAWSCCGDQDRRNLLIGNFQIHDLKQAYDSIYSDYNKKPDLTFILAHHPTNSFMGVDEDLLFNNISSAVGIEADFYLCGHIHDQIVNNLSTNHHSVTTLTCGIGWPENSESPSQMGAKSYGSSFGHRVDMNHTYGIYSFNLDENSVDLTFKRTDPSGSFQYIVDFGYGDIGTAFDFQKHYPINVYDQKPVMLSVSGGYPSLSAYISEELLSCFQRYAKYLCTFDKRVREENMVHHILYTDKVILKYNEMDEKRLSEENAKSIDDSVSQIHLDELDIYKYLIFEKYGFDSNGDVIEALDIDLDDVSKSNVKIFLDTSDIKNISVVFFSINLLSIATSYVELFEKIVDDSGCQFYAAFKILAKENTTGNNSGDNQENNVYQTIADVCSKSQSMSDSTDSQYLNVLTKMSFDCNHSLIYSANSSRVQKEIPDDWCDSIVMAPAEDWNTEIDSNNQQMPIMVFEVRISNDSGYPLLMSMDILGFENLMKEHFEELLDFYRIDIKNLDIRKQCLTWANVFRRVDQKYDEEQTN